MSRLQQVETLRMQHNQLDLELAAETLRPHPDPSRLSQLKRHKLNLKDRIARLMHRRGWFA
ncbi:YdcH family protein [Lacibacterium aquatile]|uniref:YdcH family protein n=1 Tax=Lacibacterium aquatile TaxID=1168082 RepID=A0ABW5DSN5_9PROT